MKKVVTLISFYTIFVFQLYAQQVPELNLKIVSYVKSVLGTKVNRGECWDLAYEALTQNNCEWDGNFKYGKKLNPKADSIYPGDLLQFNNVTIKYKKDGLLYKENFGMHTAIIYNVKAKGVYEIAHQNNAFSGRKVGLSELNINNLTTGTILFYRPVAKTTR